MNAFENQYKIFGMKNDMNDNIDRQQQEKYERLWENEWRDLHKIGPSVRTRNRILLRYFLKFYPIWHRFRFRMRRWESPYFAPQALQEKPCLSCW